MSEEVKSEGFKPCPFCGGKGVMLEEYGSFHVVCAKCGGSGPILFFNQSQAAIDWNRRTLEPQKDTNVAVAPDTQAKKKEVDVDFVNVPGMYDLNDLLVDGKPIARIWNSPIGLKITWFDGNQTLFTEDEILDFVRRRTYQEPK